MKKSTLVLVLLAVLAGGLTWYFEFKHPPKEEQPADALKPAFTFQADDINSIEIERQGQVIHIDRRGDTWEIIKPLDTRASKFAVNGIVNGVATAMIVKKMPGQADRLAMYGLSQPGVILRIKLKNGAQHEVKLGGKDFDGTDVYAQVDNAPDVYLFTSSLLTSSDKDLDDLRDKSVLDVQLGDVIAVDLKNAQGNFLLAKEGADWKFKQPTDAYADNTGITTILAQTSTGRMVSIVSENTDDLAKYGLAKPAITFTAIDKNGKSHTLQVGNKTGDNYYAMDPSRAMVFEISGDLFKRLDAGPQELQSKNLMHVSENDLAKVEIRNANQTADFTHQGDQWLFTAPPAQNGKEAMAWKFLTPLTEARATEVLDHPTPADNARFDKPAVDATLTPKSGKPIHISISQPDGDSVYARTDASPNIYKLPKSSLDDLNFEAADIVQAPEPPAR
jgi:Domain of unknown function (DUF4340)